MATDEKKRKIHMSIMWICVMTRVRLAGQLGKNLSIGHCLQTEQPNFFIPAVLIDTINLYDFIPLSLTLTLPGDHKVRTKQNLLTSFSPILFN